MVKLSAALNMPCAMSFPSYNGHNRALAGCAKTVASKCMQSAAAELRDDADAIRDAADADNFHDAAVSYDGTWMRRGYASLYGAFIAISWDNGKVLDYAVLSRYCHKCTRLQEQLSSGKIIPEQHAAAVAAHSCQTNTTSSAPAMESEAAALIWSRSVAQNKLCYTTFIGDGDTKSYKTVHDLQPYGPDKLVQKMECVGHVQKRVGNSLRKLKKEMAGKKLADGQKLSGRGRLTGRLIDKLQAYYGMGIRDNVNDLEAMYRANWASLMHLSSSDERSRHDFCPPGLDSWRKWQRQQAGGPPYTHHETIPKAVLEVIKPTFVRLTDRSLLERCLLGATQNRNEEFQRHGVADVVPKLASAHQGSWKCLLH